MTRALVARSSAPPQQTRGRQAGGSLKPPSSHHHQLPLTFAPPPDLPTTTRPPTTQSISSASEYRAISVIRLPSSTATTESTVPPRRVAPRRPRLPVRFPWGPATLSASLPFAPSPSRRALNRAPSKPEEAARRPRPAACPACMCISRAPCLRAMVRTSLVVEHH